MLRTSRPRRPKWRRLARASMWLACPNLPEHTTLWAEGAPNVYKKIGNSVQSSARVSVGLASDGSITGYDLGGQTSFGSRHVCTCLVTHVMVKGLEKAGGSAGWSFSTRLSSNGTVWEAAPAASTSAHRL